MKNMNSELETVTVVLLDSQMRGVAVRVGVSPLGGLLLPVRVMYPAHGIVDVTNGRYLKWKFTRPFKDCLPELQKMGENPTGRFLRGKPKLASRLAAFVGSTVTPRSEFWANVVAVDTTTGVLIPEHISLLDEIEFHPDDKVVLDSVLAAQGETA